MKKFFFFFTFIFIATSYAKEPKISPPVVVGISKDDLQRWYSALKTIKTKLENTQSKTESTSTHLTSYQNHLQSISANLQRIMHNLSIWIQNNRTFSSEEKNNLTSSFNTMFPITRADTITITSLLSELVEIKDNLETIVENLQAVAEEISEAAQ